MGAPKSKKNGGLPVIKLVGIWSELDVYVKGMVRKWITRITIQKIIHQEIYAWSTKRQIAKSNLNGAKVEAWKRVTSCSALAASAL
jgi:hypothetical protein